MELIIGEDEKQLIQFRQKLQSNNRKIIVFCVNFGSISVRLVVNGCLIKVHFSSVFGSFYAHFWSICRPFFVHLRSLSRLFLVHFWFISRPFLVLLSSFISSFFHSIFVRFTGFTSVYRLFPSIFSTHFPNIFQFQQIKIAVGEEVVTRRARIRQHLRLKRQSDEIIER